MPGAILYGLGTDVDLALGVGDFTFPAPGGGEVVGRRVNLSTFALVKHGSDTTLTSIAASGVGTFTVSVPGAQVGFPCKLGLNASGLLAAFNNSFDARVTSSDTVTVAIRNHAATALVPGTVNYHLLVFPIPLT